MNEKKRGHPYEYPNSYMQFLAAIRYYCHLDYRTLEGFCKSPSRIEVLAPDHSTIHKSLGWISLPLSLILRKSL